MKIAPREQERFCDRPTPGIRAVLLFGSDPGRVAERRRRLVKSAGPDADTEQLSPEQLKENPSRLLDEAQQTSLLGGARVVVLSDAADAAVAAVAPLLNMQTAPDALVILTAGELAPRSKLRQLFEKDERLAAVATYSDDARSLGDVLSEWSQRTGRRLQPDARRLLLDQLGANRQLSLAELEKLDLYMLSEPPDRPVEADDVRASLADSAGTDSDLPVLEACAGRAAHALRACDRLKNRGVAPEAVTAGCARHAGRLQQLLTIISKGTPPPAAMKQLRPPIFWQHEKIVQASLSRFRDDISRTTLQRQTLDLQRDLRRSPADPWIVLERYLIAVASGT